MARKVRGTTSQTRRSAAGRRGHRLSAPSRVPARMRGSLDGALPKPRRSPEESPSRPVLSWVLVTDESGRTHPEARWEI